MYKDSGEQPEEPALCELCGCSIENAYIELPALSFLPISYTAKQTLCFSCSFKEDVRTRKLCKRPWKKLKPRLTKDGGVPAFVLFEMEQCKAERQGR